MAICEKCGKEFDAKGDWQKVCIDCYKAGATASKRTTSSKASGVSAETKGKAEVMTAELFRKKYDEIVAEFVDVIEDVKPYLGGWVTSLVLDSTKARK